jgi:hypothetical protein
VITNYAELQTAIAQWLHRSDLSAVIPDFIALTEEKLNRHLRTKDNELVLTPTAIVNNRVTIPSDVVAVKSLWLDGYEGSPLKAQSLETVIANGVQGLPSIYAWQGNELVFDGTGTVEGIFYEKIPALSISNTSNWVLASYPSMYLFGALQEANLYIKNTGEASMWNGRFESVLNEVNLTDSVGLYSGPLVARAR